MQLARSAPARARSGRGPCPECRRDSARRAPAQVSCVRYSSGVMPGGHELFGILVAQLVERERAAVGDFDGAARRRRARRRTRPRSRRADLQMPLGVGEAARRRSADGRAVADGGQHVVQRQPAGRVVVHVVGGDERQRALRGTGRPVVRAGARRPGRGTARPAGSSGRRRGRGSGDSRRSRSLGVASDEAARRRAARRACAGDVGEGEPAFPLLGPPPAEGEQPRTAGRRRARSVAHSTTGGRVDRVSSAPMSSFSPAPWPRRGPARRRPGCCGR